MRKEKIYEHCININDLIDFLCFNATFSNISAISWRSVLVVKEAGARERTTDHGQATGINNNNIIKFYLKSILIKHITTQALMSFSNRLHTTYIHSSHNHAQTHQFNKNNAHVILKHNAYGDLKTT